MRFSAFLRSCLSAVALVLPLVASQPAMAQGFFQQLFGFGTPTAQPPVQQSNPFPSQGGQMTPGGRPYTLPSTAFRSTRPAGETDDDVRTSKGGAYKTVCVRLCDGYFFPISTATNRNNFYRDGQKCRATCGDDARLFHMPAGGLDVGVATDQNGRVYSLLSSAFKYRKTLVAGCQCKPDPWSDAEAARHQQYADADDAARAKLTAVAALSNKPAPAAQAAVTPDPTTIDTPAAPADAKPTKLARLTQPAKSPPAKPSAQPAATRAPAKPPTQFAAAPKPASGLPGGMGLGGGKLMWPGDAPPPRR